MRENGFNQIIHHDTESLQPYRIMSEVVTNNAFEMFLVKSGCEPADATNFLKHWHGNTCPDSIKNNPVVYVSLEDARAYAQWAHMRLPTEWDGRRPLKRRVILSFLIKFGNESERFDWYNRFVALRGGYESWLLKTSRWYFGGGPSYFKNAAGGKEPIDSHCNTY